ncbi:LysM peptidoglycan-binding domain-containing protein [Bacillus sp. BRMEA1]|uniref:LysM peptidoglycan-binding domain-containing protein n=1 Tax=Neobacillus endophyticus TaxID=2738405 RepID=UPI001564B6F0|nr:LysM peptidoglycan-binding domain-containing protein [Neobacillus endophyticus]NRD80281.1 LysM peptidoglycan-binding domain-containing protein [Neobacillus endophyticus]
MGLLQLGTFKFDIDDLPDQLPLNSEQMISVYKYPGGIKDIQTFGAFDGPITFTGTFNYTAENKANQIDKMYRNGGSYVLKVSSFRSLSVVIVKFTPIYRSPYAIDYSIELEVLGNASPAPSTSGSSYGGSSSGNKTVTTPPKSNKPAPQRVYVVKKGDTLWGISKKYYGSGTQYSKIMSANKLKNTVIIPGQRLIIP